MQAAAQAAAYAAGVGSVDGTLPSAPPSVDGSLLGRAASIRMQHSSGGSLVMPYMCACSPLIAVSIIFRNFAASFASIVCPAYRSILQYRVEASRLHHRRWKPATAQLRHGHAPVSCQGRCRLF